MQRSLIIFLFIFLSNFSFSQVKGIVIDESTKEILPYVNIWLKGGSIGTSSNEQGYFEFTKKQLSSRTQLKFSAIGYERKAVTISPTNSLLTIYLKPSITALESVSVISKRGNKTQNISTFKKKEINVYWGGSKNKSSMLAKFFPYKTEYAKTPFFKSVTFKTNTSKKSIFNVRIFKPDAEGKPGEEVYYKHILGSASVLDKTASINLSKLNIRVPKEGFFIAVEFLIIEQNAVITKTESPRMGIPFVEKKYPLVFGVLPSETDDYNWVYFGSWRHLNFKTKDTFSHTDYRNKYYSLAVEVQLIN